jgi:hypothetical protein
MKNFLPIILILFLSCGSSNKSEFEKMSKIKLPRNTKTIETFDNGEYEIDGKFIIPEKSIDSFIKENNLVPLSDVKYYRKDPVPLLKDEYKPDISNIKEFYWLDDCNSSNHWRYLLNKNSGELWIGVDYPDMSGDAPPCNK